MCRKAEGRYPLPAFLRRQTGRLARPAPEAWKRRACARLALGWQAPSSRGREKPAKAPCPAGAARAAGAAEPCALRKASLLENMSAMARPPGSVGALLDELKMKMNFKCIFSGFGRKVKPAGREKRLAGRMPGSGLAHGPDWKLRRQAPFNPRQKRLCSPPRQGLFSVRPAAQRPCATLPADCEADCPKETT